MGATIPVVNTVDDRMLDVSSTCAYPGIRQGLSGPASYGHRGKAPRGGYVTNGQRAACRPRSGAVFRIVLREKTKQTKHRQSRTIRAQPGKTLTSRVFPGRGVVRKTLHPLA